MKLGSKLLAIGICLGIAGAVPAEAQPHRGPDRHWNGHDRGRHDGWRGNNGRRWDKHRGHRICRWERRHGRRYQRCFYR